MHTDPAVDRAARRAALDHVLALIADAPWSDEVVLRGSRVMAAWYGARAREAADLDFVVLPSQIPPLDEEHRYPYLDSAEPIQQWPEAADGAARTELWTDGEDEHDHGGFHPRLAPEGLAWIVRPEPADQLPLIEYLRQAAGDNPQAGPGAMLDAEGIHGDGSWSYAYDADPYESGTPDGGDDGDGEFGEGGRPRGVRVLVPWRAPDGSAGTVQVDFAQDDRMPEPGVWTQIPVAHRWEPLVVRTASRRVSLAWKLLWLLRDAGGGGVPLCKDLYDAVLLAEDPRTGLDAGLLRRVVRDNGLPARLDAGSARVDEAAWAEFRVRCPWVSGSAGDWLARLGVALAPVMGSAVVGAR